jgi:dinuclear metal center YbgI/SA1388 family protein
MEIRQIIRALEQMAPPAYQENYDNAGLICGELRWKCTGLLCTLDATEQVIEEAMARGCNLVIAHHPIVFGALKKLSGGSYVERALIKAIKNDIAIYAIHTNLDNILDGVNRMMAEKLGLMMESCEILAPKKNMLSKLYTYVPYADKDNVEAALYAAGAGKIGNYAECSFSAPGTGTFRPLPGSNPTLGVSGGPKESVAEVKLEVIFPSHLQPQVVQALQQAHSYETVAYEVVRLENVHQEVGSGLVAQLPGAITETAWLMRVQEAFGTKVIRHTPFINRPVKRVALCGGAGSFLIKQAIAAGADAYLTADVKYHEFFDADGKILLADIGHYESEQFTTDLLANFLHDKFPTFAVLKSDVVTNPVHCYL